MKDYQGAAHHAEALATFVDDVRQVLERQDIDNDRKVEILSQVIHGPNGIKAASQVRDQAEQ